ncbi:VWA domain-containing protein [Candidatus Peregrinibacteria bacterium]|nr:VWA domain-containing protein [Candidatus Peregrinibacteria bacterium]
MIFLYPQYFWLLLMLPILGVLLVQKKKRPGIFLSVFDDLRKSTQKKWSGKFPIFLRAGLILLISLLSVMLLARPQNSYTEEKRSAEGIDIFLAFDVSESMRAEDLAPNRMEAAKAVIQKFLARTQNDRVGIILFAGKPFTESPLTFDTEMLQEYIAEVGTENINQRIPGLSGTAIGDAILAALQKFSVSADRSKVLILLTDGEANTGVDPILAAKLAAEKNVKVYTIGIGQNGGAPIPVTDMFGRKTYAVNPDGSKLLTKLDEKTLTQIADITKGKYFHATDTTALEQIFQEIGTLEKKKIETTSIVKYSENYEPYAGILIILFLGFLFLESRRISFP